MAATTTFRAVTTIEEVEHFQRLEQLIWQSPAEDTVPVHVAITVIRNGGGLIAAFDDDGPPETGGMVGLTFWFPGFGAPTTCAQGGAAAQRQNDRAATPPSPVTDLPISPLPRLKMCSHMAGVLPAWQGRGIGVQLKLAQRDAILAQGMTDWVTWTYDPLFRTNAVLNIRRLGALCNTYQRDWYGVMKDGLNAGVPSDRCQVDWWLASARVQRRVAQTDCVTPGVLRRAPEDRVPPRTCILSTTASGARFRAPVVEDAPYDGRVIAVPIPDDIAAIRRSDAALGMAWRLFVRHQLEQAFAAGYSVTDCLHLVGRGWHYLLARDHD